MTIANSLIPARKESQSQLNLNGKTDRQALSKLPPRQLIEGKAVASMIDLMNQMGAIAKHATKMFQATYCGQRLAQVNARILDHWKHVPKVSNSLVLKDTQVFYEATSSVDFKRLSPAEGSIFSRYNCPSNLEARRVSCRPPPNLSAECAKKFSDPNLFFESWVISEGQRQKKAAEMRRAKKLKKKKTKKLKAASVSIGDIPGEQRRDTVAPMSSSRRSTVGSKLSRENTVAVMRAPPAQARPQSRPQPATEVKTQSTFIREPGAVRQPPKAVPPKTNSVPTPAASSGVPLPGQSTGGAGPPIPGGGLPPVPAAIPSAIPSVVPASTGGGGASDLMSAIRGGANLKKASPAPKKKIGKSKDKGLLESIRAGRKLKKVVVKKESKKTPAQDSGVSASVFELMARRMVVAPVEDSDSDSGWEDSD